MVLPAPSYEGLVVVKQRELTSLTDSNQHVLYFQEQMASRLTINEECEPLLPTVPANVHFSPHSEKDFTLSYIPLNDDKAWRPTRGTSLTKWEHTLLNHLWAIPQIKANKQNYQLVLNCLNVHFHYSKRTGKDSTSALGSTSGTPNLRPNNASRSFSHYVVFTGSKTGIYTKWQDVQTAIQGMTEPMWEGFKDEKQAQLALHSYRISLDARNSSTNRQTADKKSAALSRQLSELKKAKTEEIANLEHEVAYLKFQLALRDQANNPGNLPISSALLNLPGELRAEIAQIATQTEFHRYLFIMDFLAENLRNLPGLQVDMKIIGGMYPYVFPEVSIHFPDFQQVIIACKQFTLRDLISLGVVSKILIEGERVPDQLPELLLDAIYENGLRPDYDPIRITCYSTPPEWRQDTDGRITSMADPATIQFLIHQPKTRDLFFLSEISADKFSQAHGSRYKFSAQDLVRRKAHTMFETLAQCQSYHTLLAEDPPVQVYGEVPSHGIHREGRLLWATRRPTVHCADETEQLAEWYEANDALASASALQTLDGMESDVVSLPLTE